MVTCPLGSASPEPHRFSENSPMVLYKVTEAKKDPLRFSQQMSSTAAGSVARLLVVPSLTSRPSFPWVPRLPTLSPLESSPAGHRLLSEGPSGPSEGGGGTVVCQARRAGTLPSPARTPSSAELTLALFSAWSAVPKDRRLVPSLSSGSQAVREGVAHAAHPLPGLSSTTHCHVSPLLAQGQAVSVRTGTQPSLVGHSPSPGGPHGVTSARRD